MLRSVFRTSIKIESKGILMFLRRLGENGTNLCPSGHHCSQILEMKDGDFAGVGADITEEAIREMLPGPGVGPGERVIRIPRRVLVSVRAEIPAA